MCGRFGPVSLIGFLVGHPTCETIDRFLMANAEKAKMPMGIHV